jgi:cyclase
MLRSRIIPCLLIHNGGLVKTIKFSQPKYVGDPINAVKIFNEKEVDELIIVDIDATVKKVEPNYELIGKIAAECRMPLCYGGGVKTSEQVERIISLGVEKVAIGSALIDNPQIISEAASRVGGQSIVAVLDILKTGDLDEYEIYSHNATRRTGINPVNFSQKLESLGVGEILLNSIDRDGLMAGYDFELVDLVREAVSVPLSVLGGAGTHSDFKKLINRYGIIGAAAGSIFVFKGKFRAVLIQYPSNSDIMNICI